MTNLIVNPFVDILKVLVNAGADPYSKVGKMEFYRELDKHKQTLMMVGDVREGVAVVQEALMNNEE